MPGLERDPFADRRFIGLNDGKIDYSHIIQKKSLINIASGDTTVDKTVVILPGLHSISNNFTSASDDVNEVTTVHISQTDSYVWVS